MQLTEEMENQSWKNDKRALAIDIMEKITQVDPFWGREYPAELFFQQVVFGIDRASIANELQLDTDISIFVQFMFKFGPAFDQQPYLQSVLADKNLTSEEKWAKFSTEELCGEELFESSEVDQQKYWFPEDFSTIEEAFPLTFEKPSFQEFYAMWYNDAKEFYV